MWIGQQRACEQGVASYILDVTYPGCNGKCCSLGEDVVEQWKLGNVVGCAELEIPVLNITVTSPPHAPPTVYQYCKE